MEKGRIITDSISSLLTKIKSYNDNINYSRYLIKIHLSKGQLNSANKQRHHLKYLKSKLNYTVKLLESKAIGTISDVSYSLNGVLHHGKFVNLTHEDIKKILEFKAILMGQDLIILEIKESKTYISDINL